jgi:predicted NBD/HSP70 family sugar kinase
MSSTNASSPWAWPELHEAQRAVLLDVLIHGSRSRADLARRTGLSRATLSRISRDLVELGLVSEGDAAPPTGRGRPSEILRVRSGAARFVGIKLTGDALYAVLSDLDAQVLETMEVHLESQIVDDVVQLIATTVDSFMQRHDRVVAVGVCLAGDVEEIDGRSVLVDSNFLGWDNVPLVDLVHAATGLPTAVANDVQALTVAHHWFGAGLGCHSMVLIGFGAGIGSGIVANDELVGGSRGHSGKISHTLVGLSGAVCERGHQGCASAFVTIPAILRNSGAADFETTLERFRGGEARAATAVGWAATALGEVVAQLINVVDPERVIITGEGLSIARLARGSFDSGVTNRLDPASEPSPIVLQDFDFSDYAWAAAIGAIRLVV